MSKYRILQAAAVIAALVAIIVALLSFGSTGFLSLATIFVIISGMISVASLNRQLASERRHRWRLQTRVDELAEEVRRAATAQSADVLGNQTSDRSTPASVVDQHDSEPDYIQLARIHSRLRDLEAALNATDSRRARNS